MIKKILIVVSVALAVILFTTLGLKNANNEREKSEKQNNEQTARTARADFFSKPISTMKGKIIKVQPSQISFCKFHGGAMISSVHEIEYVFVKTPDGWIGTFIYPCSKAIPDGEAEIHYREIDEIRIYSKKFISIFLGPEFFTEDNIPLYVVGIIDDLGIFYK